MNERGAAPIEFAFGVAILLVPTLLIVLALPLWVERTSLARSIAREAGRAVVTAGSADEGRDHVRVLVETMTANHGVAPEDVAVCQVAHDPSRSPPPTCGTVSRLERGTAVTTRVTVRLPGLSIPGMGETTEFHRTVSHTEHVERYRSLP
jgi:Flp pilus assembly protein TadG